MPLVAVGKHPIAMTAYPRGAAFWMTTKNAQTGAGPIWVWVTEECIRALDPTEVIAEDTCYEIVQRFRQDLERAASEKFDLAGVDPDDGQHEGQPIIFVSSDDVI